jgi:hypothetical protein
MKEISIHIPMHGLKQVSEILRKIMSACLDGFAQGRADGKADAIANNLSVIHCGNEHSTAFCLGYRASYFATYDLWKLSHGK